MSFWQVVQNAEIPSNFRLHQSLPNTEGTKAVCLLEAETMSELKEFAEGGLSEVSNNTYFAVEAEKALGLPIA